MAENGRVTDAEARRIVGAGATTAPPAQDASAYESSVGEGTMSRGSYVPSRTRLRGWNRPAVNDDGTPITLRTDAELAAIREAVAAIQAKLEAPVVEKPKAKTRISDYIQASKAVAAAGDYAANDILSDSATDGAGTDWDFRHCAAENGGGFWIVRASITCSAEPVLFRSRLHLFRRPVAAATEMDDNAARSIVLSEASYYIGAIDLPALADNGVLSFAENQEVRMKITCASDDDGIYGVLQTLDAETNEVAGMRIWLEFEVERVLDSVA